MRHSTSDSSVSAVMTMAAAAALMAIGAAYAGSDRNATSEQTSEQISRDAHFERFDVDRDGAITRAEAAREPRFAKGFDAADENRDGKLDSGEYVKAQSIYERELVSVYGRDSLITAKVKAALLRDPEVSGLGVRVKTDEGVVLLSGKVTDRAEAERARTVARRVRGVIDVRDEFEMAR